MESRWITLGCLGKKKDPGPELVGPESLISRLLHAWKRGAEGQSRTDTGLPPPVFECDAIPGHKLALVIISAKIEANNYL